LSRGYQGGILRKLCIVGGGVTKDRAPFDSDCDIWSTASVGLGLPRIDAIFELHNGIFKPEDLNKAGCVVYMKDHTDDVYKSVAFPIQDLIDVFGKHFNGTVPMILAFAALEGYEDISLYGIDFSSDDEFSRRNQFYWLMGYLSAIGVKITICPGGYMNDTCATYMYEDDGKAYINDIKNRAKDQLTEDESNIMALRERKAYMRGVSDTIANIERRL
jgi:hypothetical protein